LPFLRNYQNFWHFQEIIKILAFSGNCHNFGIFKKLSKKFFFSILGLLEIINFVEIFKAKKSKFLDFQETL